MRVSIDANILVCFVDRDAGDRHHRALQVLEQASGADCVLTLQTLGEFFNVATRKSKIEPATAAQFIDDWRQVFPVHAADLRALDDALAATRQHRLPFWDAMLWATVQQAGCGLLLTEDFQDGRVLGSVTFVNPFDPGNDELLDRALPPTVD